MDGSLNTDVLRDIYVRWKHQMDTMPEMPIELLRAQFDEWNYATLEPEGVMYRQDVVGGVPGLWVLPEDGARDSVLLYFHGGGFAVGSSASHRRLVGHLSTHLRVPAFVLDYRRSPEHPFPSQIEDALAAYEALLDRGYAPERIGTAGDSAGGNLAVSSVLAMRGRGLPLPSHVIALSPWLDMAHTGASLEANKDSDVLIDRAVLESMAAMFLGASGSPDDALANPLHGSFTGYPRLYIDAGGDEMLLDDAVRLDELARNSGVDVTLSVVDGMQHVFPFSAGRSREADEELERIAGWFHQGER